MTTHLERELGRILHERAAEITATPQYVLGPERAPRTTESRARFRKRPRRTWMPLASAAAVAVIASTLAVAVWLGARWVPHPDSTAVTRCVSTGTSPFATALGVGELPSGDVVLSGAADGTALIAVQRDGMTKAVEVLSPSGLVSAVWTARPGQRVRAVANPSGAVNETWAVFVVTPVDGTGASRVLVADRATRHAFDLQLDAGYSVTDDALTAPVVIGDAVSVLVTSRHDPSARQIALYWAETTRRASDVRVSTSAVTGVLPVGGNVVTIRTLGGGRVGVDFDQPQYRPQTLPPDARLGYAFASDGTTLTWLTSTGVSHRLWRWAPGDPAPRSNAFAGAQRPENPIGRFATTGSGTATTPQLLIDSTTGAVVEMPLGVALLRIDGPTATLSDSSASGVRYVRMPAAALTTC